MYTSAKPSIAPYPTVLPNVAGGPRASSAQAQTRSRMTLLRSRKQLPDPATEFTSSSLHPPARGHEAAVGDGRRYSDYGGGLEGTAAPTRGYGGGGQLRPVAAVHADSAAAGDVADSYVRNLREQVNVLQSEVAMYKSGKPVVEAHQCDLMEELQHDARTAAERAKQTEAKMQAEAQTVGAMRREVHDLRKMIATERAAASSVEDEKRFALRQRDAVEAAKAKAEMQHGHAVKRVDTMENEIAYLRRELAASRQKEADFIAHSTGTAGLVRSTDGQHRGDDAEVHGLVPAHIASRVVSQYQRILSERNTFEAERDELQRQADECTKLIQTLTESLTASQKETAKLVDQLRHEQQRYHMLLATTQSDVVSLDEANRELAFLKLANKELTIDRDRLTSANEALFAKMRAMIDERQVSDLAVSNTLEATKHLQVETRHVHDALLEEQKLTELLRADVHRLMEELHGARTRSETLEQRIKVNAADGAKHDLAYAERMQQLEAALKGLQFAHATAHSAEAQSLTSAAQLLESLRRTTNLAATAPLGEASAPAAATTPAPATTTTPVPAPAPAPAAAAAAAGYPVSIQVQGFMTPGPGGASIMAAPAAAMQQTVAAAAAAKPAAPAAALTAAVPAAADAAAAKPVVPPQLSAPIANIFDAAKAAMEREQQMRKEAAMAVAAAGRAMIRNARATPTGH